MSTTVKQLEPAKIWESACNRSTVQQRSVSYKTIEPTPGTKKLLPIIIIRKKNTRENKQSLDVWKSHRQVCIIFKKLRKTYTRIYVWKNKQFIDASTKRSSVDFLYIYRNSVPTKWAERWADHLCFFFIFRPYLQEAYNSFIWLLLYISIKSSHL